VVHHISLPIHFGMLIPERRESDLLTARKRLFRRGWRNSDWCKKGRCVHHSDQFPWQKYTSRYQGSVVVPGSTFL